MSNFLNMPLGEFFVWLLTLQTGVVLFIVLFLVLFLLLAIERKSTSAKQDEIIELLKQIRWNIAPNNQRQDTTTKSIPSDTNTPRNQ